MHISDGLSNVTILKLNFLLPFLKLYLFNTGFAIATKQFVVILDWLIVSATNKNKQK